MGPNLMRSGEPPQDPASSAQRDPNVAVLLCHAAIITQCSDTKEAAPLLPVRGLAPEDV